MAVMEEWESENNVLETSSLITISRIVWQSLCAFFMSACQPASPEPAGLPGLARCMQRFITDHLHPLQAPLIVMSNYSSLTTSTPY